MEIPASTMNAKAIYPVLELDSEITPANADAGDKQPQQLGAKIRLAREVAKRVFIKPFTSQFFSQILNGQGRRSEQQLRIKYIGDGSQLHYLKTLCFEDSVKASNAKPLSLFSLTTAINNAHDCDLLLVDMPMPLNLLLNMPGRFTPQWLKQFIELPADWQEFLSTLRRKTRMEAQRIIRKFELKSRIVPAEDYAGEFYRTLYKPYTLERHGESTVIDDEASFVNKAQGSYIMQLMRGEQILAGSQIRQTGNSFSIGAVGMDLSLPFKEQMCLIDAMDYFALMHAVQLGCSTVDMGLSRANLNDGILRYKKKWGANIQSGFIPKGSISIKAMNTCPAVLDFYSNNILVCKKAGALTALKLVRNDDAVEKLPSQLQQLSMPGLEAIDVIVPNDKQHTLETLPNFASVHGYHNDEQLLRQLNN